MDIIANFKKALNAIIRRYGYEIINSKSLYEWQRFPQAQPVYRKSEIPQDAINYLQPNNHRLKELQDRYADFNHEITTPLIWKDGHVRSEDILYFRGDNAYLWQLRDKNNNIMSYALTAYYVKSIDKLGLMDVLEEDEFFGNFTFNIDNKLISRDLLDSINQIYFLEKHLNISRSNDLNILDIGAGYGRLAHRMVNALPNIQNYLCTDAVAVSTFISEYYLRFRNLRDRVKVIPLDEIEDTLRNRVIDIAVNIHSFSECRVSAIEWWLSLLTKYGIKYLMIIPNALWSGGKLMLTCDGKDFMPILERSGYNLIAKEPKYGDDIVQQYAISPTYYYLYKL
jgi:hypothetical protein